MRPEDCEACGGTGRVVCTGDDCGQVLPCIECVELKSAFFEEPDGEGEPTVWHKSPLRGAQPSAIVRRSELPEPARKFWALVVRGFVDV